MGFIMEICMNCGGGVFIFEGSVERKGKVLSTLIMALEFSFRVHLFYIGKIGGDCGGCYVFWGNLKVS